MRRNLSSAMLLVAFLAPLSMYARSPAQEAEEDAVVSDGAASVEVPPPGV
jgi:hypothetical protein